MIFPTLIRTWIYFADGSWSRFEARVNLPFVPEPGIRICLGSNNEIYGEIGGIVYNATTNVFSSHLDPWLTKGNTGDNPIDEYEGVVEIINDLLAAGFSLAESFFAKPQAKKVRRVKGRG